MTMLVYTVNDVGKNIFPYELNIEKLPEVEEVLYFSDEPLKLGAISVALCARYCFSKAQYDNTGNIKSEELYLVCSVKSKIEFKQLEEY